MKIYTRTGDDGTTGLLGGKRVSKAHVRLHACGTIDELNASLGVLITHKECPLWLRTHILWIQHRLFSVGADLALPLKTPVPSIRVTDGDAATLETWIDELSAGLPSLQSFILPGGSTVGALLHQARTTCRRAERWIVSLKQTEAVPEAILTTMNRLSDYLFIAARHANQSLGIRETLAEIRIGTHTSGNGSAKLQ